MDKLLSIEDIAEILGLEYKSIYRLIRSGELPAARIGRVYRVNEADLASYIESQKQALHEETTGQKLFAQREVRCGSCGQRIVSELGIAGRCEVCQAALCAECFGIKKEKCCKAHQENG
ncbi:MAG: helix-turn-helix domain-containing protein [Sedimentisphaerales bacterium]|nr:helix-turn-helix domain-containing protein [Sedimentisphaerales bacterium]